MKFQLTQVIGGRISEEKSGLGRCDSALQGNFFPQLGIALLSKNKAFRLYWCRSSLSSNVSEYIYIYIYTFIWQEKIFFFPDLLAFPPLDGFFG